MLQLVGGVVWMNLIFLLVGYAALARFLRGRRAGLWVTHAGVALLVGAGLVGVALSELAVAGMTIGLPLFGVVAAGLSIMCLSVAGARYARTRSVEQPSAARTDHSIVHTIPALAAGGLAAICAIVLVAGFRASPWLDDAWTFWLPKGVELTRSGLDARAFAHNVEIESFANTDYPLWWSIVGGLDVAAVGRIDLRALDAQLAVLYVAFVAAGIRLLWGHVRPTILLPAMLMAAAAPELVAQAESGGADLPLAFYVSLAVLGGVLWLQRRQPPYLWLTFVFVATALHTKNEAIGLVLVLLVVGGCFVTGDPWGQRARLLGTVAAAFVTLTPWLAWTRVHDVRSEAFGAGAFDPSHLWEQRARLWPAMHEVAAQSLAPRSWFLAVPLLVGISVTLAIRDRRAGWLGPAVAVGGAWALFVWIYWAGSIELSFWLETSAYRVVDSVAVASALALPIVVERLVSSRSAAVRPVLLPPRTRDA